MDKLQEIIQRRREFSFGSIVVNCVAHGGISILERPRSCELCAADIVNTLRRAMTANAFMNELLDELEKIKVATL